MGPFLRAAKWRTLSLQRLNDRAPQILPPAHGSRFQNIVYATQRVAKISCGCSMQKDSFLWEAARESSLNRKRPSCISPSSRFSSLQFRNCSLCTQTSSGYTRTLRLRLVSNRIAIERERSGSTLLGSRGQAALVACAAWAGASAPRMERSATASTAGPSSRVQPRNDLRVLCFACDMVQAVAVLAPQPRLARQPPCAVAAQDRRWERERSPVEARWRSGV